MLVYHTHLISVAYTYAHIVFNRTVPLHWQPFVQVGMHVLTYFSTSNHPMQKNMSLSAIFGLVVAINIHGRVHEMDCRQLLLLPCVCMLL